MQAADGEGVVGIFGFPVSDDDHAKSSPRRCIESIPAYENLQKTAIAFRKCDVHMGIEFRLDYCRRLRMDDEPGSFTIGEPVELARRFCIANRFYGSRILIGPRTFELASKTQSWRGRLIF